MSVQLYELAKSRATVVDLKSGSTTVEYVAQVLSPYAVSDDQDLLAAVQGTAPLRYGFQQRRTIDLKPQGGPVWLVTVTYGFDEGDPVSPPPGDLLPYDFSFDTTGGTQHVTQSLETVSSYKYGVPTRTINDVATRIQSLVDAAATVGSSNVTSASANFGLDDVGASLSSTTPGWLPPGAFVLRVTGATTIVMGSPAAGAGSPANALATVAGAALVVASATVTSDSGSFTQSDVGAVLTSTFPGWLPDGARIVAVSPTKARLSGPVQNLLAGLPLTIVPPPPTDFNRAIGVSKDGVAGCDKVAPKTEFQVSRYLQGVSLVYIRTLHELTGTVNDAEFYGFERGELLFQGAQGAPSQNNAASADPLVRVTYRFAASPNRTNVDLVPDDALGNHLLRLPEKAGWDYLWVFYKDEIDPVSHVSRPRPEGAYVERIYELGDFSTLRIGVG